MLDFENWFSDEENFYFEANATTPAHTTEFIGVPSERELRILGNDFLKRLNQMLTEMIGKTLAIYKNKDSDGYARTAISLDNFKRNIGMKYKNFIINTWFKSLDVSPPVAEAYSLEDYRKLMYQRSYNLYQKWLKEPAPTPELEDAKAFIRGESGITKPNIEMGKTKKLGKEVNLQNLNDIVRAISKTKYGPELLNAQKVMNGVKRLEQMTPQQFAQFLEKNMQGMEDLKHSALADMEYYQNKKGLQRREKGQRGVIAGSALATTGTGLLVDILLGASAATMPIYGLGALGALIYLYAYLKKGDADRDVQYARTAMQDTNREIKENLAAKYLAQVNQIVGQLGRELASKYVGKLAPSGNKPEDYIP